MDDGAGDTGFAYDSVDYPSGVDAQLTPDHIRAVGLFHGWDAPDPATASVLEIGCYDGLNLIAVAAVYPRARCVGFDLAARGIEQGRLIARAAGVDNVELRHDDILEFPRAGEQFDYVVCHGVYSWVPQAVRDALPGLIAARLAPGGVAYLGYDALPGCGAKYAIATYLQRLVGRIPEFDARLDATEQVIDTLARNHDATSQLKPQLEALRTMLRSLDRGYVFHDWLAPHYRPDWTREVAARSAAAGLRHVADVTFGDDASYDLDEDARRLLALAGDDFVERADALAVLRGTRLFRTDLLVRADAPPAPLPDAMHRISYTFLGNRVPSEPSDAGASRFDVGENLLVTADPTLAAILDALEAAAPGELGFDALRRTTGAEPPELEATLRGLVLRSVLQVHSTPQPFTLTPGERPLAGRLIRAMLNMGDQAVSLRHRRVVAGDKPARLLMALCDGTRTVPDLAQFMQDALGEPVSGEQVAASILDLARRQLFEA
jgi:hypothetical protein